MFYCSAGDDGTKSKHGMVAYGMELVATLFFVFLSQLIMGVFNIRFNNFICYVLIISPCPLISYYVINSYYIKSGRHNTIIEKYATTSNRKKAIYKTIVIFLSLILFALLFVGGILMSYLFSLYT
jgi:hypothetical protein